MSGYLNPSEELCYRLCEVLSKSNFNWSDGARSAGGYTLLTNHQLPRSVSGWSLILPCKRQGLVMNGDKQPGQRYTENGMRNEVAYITQH